MSVNIQTSSGLVKIAGTPTIDTALSNVSKNPVQNKVITEKIDEINSNLTSEISRAKETEETLKSRIDTITSLPEGSTTGDAELQDIRVKADGTTATSAGNAVREQFSELKSDLVDIATITENLVKLSSVETKKYYANQYLNKIDNNGYALFNLINLKPNTTYTLGSVSRSFSWVSRTGSSNTKLSTYFEVSIPSSVIEHSDGSVTFTTDDITNGIYISCSIDEYNSLMLIEGGSLPNRYVEDKVVEIENFKNNPIKYTYLYVNKSYHSYDTIGYGTIRFKSIIEAIKSIKESSYNNRYVIYVNADYYDIYTELGGSTWLNNLEDGERCGIVLPDYVDLIGYNGLATLEMAIPNDLATLQNSTKISTLNIWKHNTIKNLIVKATNCRYACHIETNNVFNDTNIVVENCEFYHLGATKTGLWTSRQGVACGTGSGGYYKFSNCYMYSKDTQPFTIHNNINQNTNTVIFDGCHFGRGAENNNADICFYTVSSTQSGSEKDVAKVKSCIFNRIDIDTNNIWQVCDYVNGTITDPNI